MAEIRMQDARCLKLKVLAFYTIYADNISRQTLFTKGTHKLAEKDNVNQSRVACVCVHVFIDYLHSTESV